MMMMMMMTRKSFIKGIEEAEKRIIELNGICSALERAISGRAKDEFNALFDWTIVNEYSGEGSAIYDDDMGVGIDDLGCYFYGERNKKNIPLRLTALHLFKEICLESKIYKEWDI